MSEIEWLNLLVFPSILLSTLVALYWGPYRRLSDLNEVFERGRRTQALSVMLTSVIILAIAAFVAVQTVRISILLVMMPALMGRPTVAFTVFGTSLFCVSIICELMVLIHLFFYLILCRQGVKSYRMPHGGLLPSQPPGVAVLIPACDEPADVLDRSLSSVQRIRYPNLRILLVENSRDPACKKAAHALAEKRGIAVVDLPNRGTKAGALNDARRLLDDGIEYILVLDADQFLEIDILTELVPRLEADLRLAFVQTAQAYENFVDSLVTFAAAQQQMLLYDCVMEGKAARGRALCLGTGFVMRLAALDSVGGWDETNVTEDLATSYHIHARGWKSEYYRKIYAKGLALPSLDAYWRQQRRWAIGNSGLALSLITKLFQHRNRSLPLVADYVWSASFYLNTFVLATLALAPTAVLIMGFLLAPESLSFRYELNAPAWAFTSFYVLYVVVLLFPYVNMSMRGYPLRNMMLVHGLTTVTTPVYLKGVKRALLEKGPVLFESSARNKSSIVTQTPLLRSPQTLSFVVFSATGSVFTALAIASPGNPIPWILAFWSFVHGVSLGHFFMFRLPGSSASQALF